MVHGDDIIYIRIDWENYSSDKTPLNERNLNKMDLAIHLLDERVVWLNGNKFDKIEAFKLIKDIDLNEDTGIFTITYYDDRKKQIDTILEKVATNWDYDSVSQQLVITLDDGTVKRVDLSALIAQYEFMTSDTISFEVQPDGKVKAIVREGSIQEKHLRPDYLADIRLEQGKAQQSAADAEGYAKLSESYAHGGTGVREGEGSDNAMEYARQAKESADRAEEAVSGAAVTGVKGECEPGFRTGNVVIYPQNIFKTIVFRKSIPQSEEWEEILSGKSVLKVSGVYVAYIKIVDPYDESEIKGGYAGIMHWDPSGLNYGGTDEILLHSSKELNNGVRVYLRTQRERDVIGNAKLRLQISFSEGSSSNVSLIIEFVKIL